MNSDLGFSGLGLETWERNSSQLFFGHGLLLLKLKGCTLTIERTHWEASCHKYCLIFRYYSATQTTVTSMAQSKQFFKNLSMIIVILGLKHEQQKEIPACSRSNYHCTKKGLLLWHIVVSSPGVFSKETYLEQVNSVHCKDKKAVNLKHHKNRVSILSETIEFLATNPARKC